MLHFYPHVDLSLAQSSYTKRHIETTTLHDIMYYILHPHNPTEPILDPMSPNRHLLSLQYSPTPSSNLIPKLPIQAVRTHTDSASRRPPNINENTALSLYDHNHTHGKDSQRTSVRNTNHTHVHKTRTLAKTPRSACEPFVRRFPPRRASVAHVFGPSTAIVPRTPGKIQPTHCLSIDSRWHTCSPAWHSE